MQISAEVINVSTSYSSLFNNDSCLMNQTTPYCELCTVYRGSALTLSARNTAFSHIGTVENVDLCEWIRKSVPETNVLQYFPACSSLN